MEGMVRADELEWLSTISSGIVREKVSCEPSNLWYRDVCRCREMDVGMKNMKGFSLIVGCDLHASYCRVSIEVCIQFPLQELMRTQTPHCSPELRVPVPK